MVVPAGTTGPLPNPDMPEDVQRDYEEARGVESRSPRAAAALLRLALQRLMPYLGKTDGGLNENIAALVREGIDADVGRAADILRVTGNNAVHPGEMNLDDDPKVVAGLFGLINLIVDDRISQPRRVNELFQGLPEGARAQIDSRDAPDAERKDGDAKD